MTDQVDQILQQWRVARPDLDVSPMAVVGRLSRVANHVTARQRETFARYDLDPASFDVLATLRRSARQQLTPQQLTATAMISSAATAQRINRLEGDGLVARRPHPEDGRSVHVVLTRRGASLVDRVLPAHLDTEQQVLDSLTTAERAQLQRLLAKMLRSIEAPPG